MSLVLIEGFDGWDENTYLNFIDIGRVYGGFPFKWDFPTGRDNRGKCLHHISSDGGYFHQYFPGSMANTYVVGVAIKTLGGGNTGSLCLRSGSTDCWEIRSSNSGTLLTFYCNGVSRGTKNISIGTWYYIEVKYYGHDSSGIFIVKVDGSILINLSSFDSLPSGVENPDGLFYYCNIWHEMQWDDVYVLDNTGSSNNDFLGDCRVDAVFPNGDGNYSQMTPSAGNNYECVDEDPISTSDYVTADADGEKDTYTFADVPTDINDSDIAGIMVRTVSKRSHAYPNVFLRSMCRSNGSDYYDGSGVIQGDLFYVVNYPLDVDPDDSNNWTKAKINGCEFGVELEKV